MPSDDISMHVLTRFSTLTVTSSGTTPGATGLFTVDGVTVPAAPANSVLSAPFASRVMAAAGGEVILPGQRTPFVQWDDAPAQPRTRIVVTPLTDASYNATYSGAQYQLRVDLTGGVNGVEPAVLTSLPASTDLWYTPSTDVTLTAATRTGFEFLGWTGDLTGQPNPAAVTMSAPVFAGADFDLVYAVADTTVDLVATQPVSLQLQVENGTSPVSWTVLGGTTPLGIAFNTSGAFTGSSLDLGAYPLTLRATDALGLTATATVTLQVDAPSIPIGQLGADFLLGTSPLDSIQTLFLDRQGNRNGAYDLGDFRAWVLANPGLPLSADLVATDPAVVETGVIVLPVRLHEPEGPR
jgi:hypothetical protein